MRKFVTLILKEVRIAFRDVGSVVMMIAVPILLTLAVSLAFGGGDATIEDLSVLVLNQDSGEIGSYLMTAFESDAVAEMVDATEVEDESGARAAVEADAAVALVTIPEDFSASVLATDQAADAEPVIVEVYASPTHPVGSSVVRSIVVSFVEQASMVAQGVRLVLGDLVASGAIAPEDAAAMSEVGERLNDRITALEAEGARPEMDVLSVSGRAFSWLNYFAPSMAILFLMFAATGGGRTLLSERTEGTLPRLLVTPTPAPVILVGKMSGVAITGLLQVLALWGATSLTGAEWGDPLSVLLSNVLLVVSATGLGAIIAAWARSETQAGALGTTVVLAASAVSGNFLPRMNLPVWLQNVSLAFPNGWGLELFTRIQAGATLSDLVPLWGWLLVLTLVYYIVAAIGFRRQFV
ncbi:MAG: ABC transporter permease [Chloroflexi bacterium]|jgi:ABC-2 type transport system permease protein|nr:ABC transporter permease [Chloroflexota bacterium]